MHWLTVSCVRNLNCLDQVAKRNKRSISHQYDEIHLSASEVPAVYAELTPNSQYAEAVYREVQQDADQESLKWCRLT